MKLLRRARLIHKAEGVAVTIATAGAASGLKHIELGIPLEQWGLYADLVAGSLAFGHFVHHRLHRKETHG